MGSRGQSHWEAPDSSHPHLWVCLSRLERAGPEWRCWGCPRASLPPQGTSTPKSRSVLGQEGQRAKPRTGVGGGLSMGWVRGEGWAPHPMPTDTETCCLCKGRGAGSGIPLTGPRSWDPSLRLVAVSLVCPGHVPLSHRTPLSFFHGLPFVINFTSFPAQSPSHLGTWTLRFSVIPWSSWSLSW